MKISTKSATALLSFWYPSYIGGGETYSFRCSVPVYPRSTKEFTRSETPVHSRMEMLVFELRKGKIPAQNFYGLMNNAWCARWKDAFLRATAMSCGSGDKACCSVCQDHVQTVLSWEKRYVVSAMFCSAKRRNEMEWTLWIEDRIIHEQMIFYHGNAAQSCGMGF